ncbi:hypothetical protein AB0C13_41020 [Streptomyces sp. NPDC049099]|uniref:hypothetical protein n=1 Tax=Streptomyces sp. NPDC049099 TaxID=3155768 RepID=UPI0034246D50
MATPGFANAASPAALTRSIPYPVSSYGIYPNPYSMGYPNTPYAAGPYGNQNVAEPNLVAPGTTGIINKILFGAL